MLLVMVGEFLVLETGGSGQFMVGCQSFPPLAPIEIATFPPRQTRAVTKTQPGAVEANQGQVDEIGEKDCAESRVEESIGGQGELCKGDEGC